MFTGIIEKTGKISDIVTKSGSKRLKIQYTSAEPLKVGESINVNGACQTVVEIEKGSFWVEAMQETLTKTNLDVLQIGDEVNLERSLKLSDRISGHLVSGHVDTVGRVLAIQTMPESWIFKIDFPKEFTKYIVSKGSISVNGISLTVIDAGQNNFTVGIIPYSWQNTNLRSIKIGDSINLEFDLLAKYVESVLKVDDDQEKITSQYLRDAGW
jgi:riboflavin synthase